jgi:hypothetical protein
MLAAACCLRTLFASHGACGRSTASASACRARAAAASSCYALRTRRLRAPCELISSLRRRSRVRAPTLRREARPLP